MLYNHGEMVMRRVAYAEMLWTGQHLRLVIICFVMTVFRRLISMIILDAARYAESLLGIDHFESLRSKRYLKTRIRKCAFHDLQGYPVTIEMPLYEKIQKARSSVGVKFKALLDIIQKGDEKCIVFTQSP